MAQIFHQQTVKLDETITAKYTPKVDWKQDPTGYFLIRLSEGKIEVGFVTNDHVVKKRIVGDNATVIYYTLIKHKLLSKVEHAAYLGKELYKAELALKLGKQYVQDSPLDLS